MEDLLLQLQAQKARLDSTGKHREMRDELPRFVP